MAFETKIVVPSLMHYASINEKSIGLRWSSKGPDGTLYYFETRPERRFRVLTTRDEQGNLSNHMTVFVTMPPAKIPEWVESFLAGYEDLLKNWGEMKTTIHYVHTDGKEVE